MSQRLGLPLSFGGKPIFLSHQLPVRGTKLGPMKLSPFVTVSDGFRAATDAWLRDFFGDAPHPQPVEFDAIFGYGMIFVSPKLYARLRELSEL